MEATIGKKDKILDAAAQLIVENGLQCSMAAIAERAGVATGSLYNYFPSKRAMVLGVYVRVGEQMSRAVVVEHADEVSHEGRIKGYIANYIEFIAADAERAKLFEYLDHSPELSLTDSAATFSGFVDIYSEAPYVLQYRQLENTRLKLVAPSCQKLLFGVGACVEYRSMWRSWRSFE